MLLFKNDGALIGRFEHFNELAGYIAQKESVKRGNSDPACWKPAWSFAVLSSDEVGDLLHTLPENHEEKELVTAWERQLSIVQMCEGDCKDIHYVLVEGAVNIESLREDWCLDYFTAHGMYLTQD
jgi:hypothetical protein